MTRTKRKPKWELARRWGDRLPIRTLVDVGVNRGTRELYAAFPDVYTLLVEPQQERAPDLEKILTRRPGEYVIAAAGAAAGTATIRVEPRYPAKSSLFDRADATATGDEVEHRDVPVVRLDELCKQRKLSGPYGIKVDTEGFELEVLRGATDVLADTRFVIAEMTVAERFEGGYRASELISLMYAQGFGVRDVLHSTRSYVDALFLPLPR